MHPVIKHILERHNKAVPVNDGRKIILVLFGGAMLGIHGTSALVALEEMGLTNVFDEIYTISSGFPSASSFLSGQARQAVAVYYTELLQGQFVNLKRFWNIINTDFLVHVMRDVRGLDVKRILASKTKVYACLFNLDKKTPEYLEVHDYDIEGYFRLLKAAVCVPYFNPGNVKIGGYRYEEIPLKHKYYNDFVEHAVHASKATDVLIIYNQLGQVKLKKAQPAYVCEIVPPRDWSLKRLENNPGVLQAAAKRMGAFIKQQFGQPGEITLDIK